MEIKFSCSTKELLQALNLLKAVVPKGGASKRRTLELDFRVNEIDLKIRGALQTIYCRTEGFGKVVVPFLYFMQVVIDSKEENFSPTISEGKMNCGRVTIFVDTDFTAPKAIKKIDRSLNLKRARRKN